MNINLSPLRYPLDSQVQLVISSTRMGNSTQQHTASSHLVLAECKTLYHIALYHIAVGLSPRVKLEISKRGGAKMLHTWTTTHTHSSGVVSLSVWVHSWPLMVYSEWASHWHSHVARPYERLHAHMQWYIAQHTHCDTHALQHAHTRYKHWHTQRPW